jgi:hypothetical protein
MLNIVTVMEDKTTKRMKQIFRRVFRFQLNPWPITPKPQAALFKHSFRPGGTPDVILDSARRAVCDAICQVKLLPGRPCSDRWKT